MKLVIGSVTNKHIENFDKELAKKICERLGWRFVDSYNTLGESALQLYAACKKCDEGKSFIVGSHGVTVAEYEAALKKCVCARCREQALRQAR